MQSLFLSKSSFAAFYNAFFVGYGYYTLFILLFRLVSNSLSIRKIYEIWTLKISLLLIVVSLVSVVYFLVFNNPDLVIPGWHSIFLTDLILYKPLIFLLPTQLLWFQFFKTSKLYLFFMAVLFGVVPSDLNTYVSTDSFLPSYTLTEFFIILFAFPLFVAVFWRREEVQ